MTQSFIFVISIFVIVATFVNTDFGLIIILMGMLLSPEVEAGSTAGRSIVIRAEDLLLILVAITWLAKMAIKKLPVIRKSPLNIPIGVFIAILCLSTLKGMFSGNVSPVKGSFYVVKIIEFFVLYFIVLNHVTTVKQVKKFLLVLLLVSVVVGIYGNTHIGKVARISAPFEGKGEPNTLGGYILFILCILAALIMYIEERRILLIILFVFLCPTLLFTLSRSTYLAIFPSLITLILLSKNKKVINWAIIVALAFIVTVFIGPPVLRNRVIGAFKPEEGQELKNIGRISLGPSPAARVISWKTAVFRKFPKSPLLGRGVTGAGFLDNQFVLILVENGIIGLLAYIWLLWRIWKVALKSFHLVETPLFKGLSMGFLVGFIGLLFHSVGCNTFIIIRIAEPFWFFTAIMAKLADIESGEAQMEETLQRYGDTSWRYQT